MDNPLRKLPRIQLDSLRTCTPSQWRQRCFVRKSSGLANWTLPLMLLAQRHHPLCSVMMTMLKLQSQVRIISLPTQQRLTCHSRMNHIGWQESRDQGGAVDYDVPESRISMHYQITPNELKASLRYPKCSKPKCSGASHVRRRSVKGDLDC